jgi:uncharacterized protein involved in exopolysaccharide biosynthesis
VLFDKKKTIDFREIRRMLWRRRLLIAIPCVVTVAAGILGIFFIEPSYLATATLAMERPAPLTRAVEAATGGSGRNRGTDEARVLRKKIMASSFLESVAVQIGLHENPRLIAMAQRQVKENPGYEFRDLLLRQCVTVLTRMLDVRSEGNDIFYIRSVSNSPELAYKVADTVAQLYIQSNRQNSLDLSEDAHKFSEDQMAIYETKLEEKRRQLREYEQQMALRPLSQSPVTETNVGRVSALVASADADIEFLLGRHAAVRTRIQEAGVEAFLDLGMIESTKLGALKQTLFELERHLALTLVEYEEDEPAVTSAENQIAVKSQQLLTELDTVTAAAFPSIVEEYRDLLVDFEFTRTKLEATNRRKQALQDFMAKYAEDLAEMPAAEFRLNRLREDVESAQRLYQTWLEQATSTQIAKAVQSASIGNQLVLIEPARIPLSPFEPDKQKIVILSIVMGIALGIGAAIVAEYLDLTLKSVEEIEAVLEAPILGAVPKMQAAVIEDMEVRRRRRIQVLVPSLIATTVAFAAFGYYYFFVLNSVGG